MHYVYIIKSSKWDKYYIGETQNIESRLNKHNNSGVKSTKNGIPWKLIWYTHLENRSAGRILEKQIKSRGAARYLKDLNIID